MPRFAENHPRLPRFAKISQIYGTPEGLIARGTLIVPKFMDSLKVLIFLAFHSHGGTPTAGWENHGKSPPQAMAISGETSGRSWDGFNHQDSHGFCLCETPRDDPLWFGRMSIHICHINVSPMKWEQRSYLEFPNQMIGDTLKIIDILYVII